MAQAVTISLPIEHPYSNEELYHFSKKYRGILNVHYRRSVQEKVTFTSTNGLRDNVNFIPFREDFFNTFTYFNRANMKKRSSDLFNEPTNAQLAQDIQDKALASEREAQERALMEKHNVIKEITYISKCGKFTANSLDDLITKMNQATLYAELVTWLPSHLKIKGKDTDYRDILEHIANNYTLEKRKG